MIEGYDVYSMKPKGRFVLKDATVMETPLGQLV